MPQLFLQSFDANSGLSISLRHGQSCTIGLSTVADYRVNAIGVSAVHCRVVCRPSGGFIECLEEKTFIVINGAYRSRSRISHGDLLKIGAVSVSVKMPTPNIGFDNFNIDLSNETETTSSDFSIDFDSDEQDEIIVSDGIIDVEMPASQNSATQHAADNSISSIHSELSSSAFVNLSEDELKMSDATQTQLNPLDRPFFEFDSTESADATISIEELECVPQTENFANAPLSEPLHGSHANQASTSDEANDDIQNTPTTSSADGSDHSNSGLSSPTDTGKFFKWTGDNAVAVFHQMQNTQAPLNIYRILSGQIKSVSEADIRKHLSAKIVPAVFLLSKLSSEDLMSQIQSRKWIDRIGHPQAITMFLTLSPKRLVTEFFTLVSVCLLLQNDEVELLGESPLRISPENEDE